MPLTLEEAIQMGGRTARWLAYVDLADDAYHQDISNAAKILMSDGRGDYEYDTQYASGNSHWYIPGDPTVRVLVDIHKHSIW